LLDIALLVGVQIILSQMQVYTDEMRENYINPTCSLYAYNSLILKCRFFEFRKMYHTNFSSSL